MFRTVRHWWGSGRGKVTARLFVFEFVVVVAGVLVAQWLANAAQQQSAYRRMEVAREGSLQDLGIAAKVARDWRNLHTCLADQVTEIMQRLARGQSLDAELLTLPSTRFIKMNAPEGDDFLLLAKRYGRRYAEFIRFGQYKVENLTNHWNDIADEWGAFQLVDPANGPVSQSDRDEARHAAARIKALVFRSSDADALGVIGSARVLRVQPNDPIFGRSARDCAEYERTKALYPRYGGKLPK